MRSKPVEVRLDPEDNQRLARLCGSLDENLRQIESALDVTIARRGSKFTVRGEQAQRAAQAIEHFYDRASGELTLDDVQLALTCAVDALERDKVKRIVLVRPAVEAGERLGFLPGDLAQKVDPYLRPLYDALYDLMGFDKTGKLLERGTIELAPLAYMRGRTLNHSFIILDEAQNTTPEQMKMFLTRIGFGAKAVVNGDITQIDLGRGQKSGLIEARRILAGVRGIAFTEFGAQYAVPRRGLPSAAALRAWVRAAGSAAATVRIVGRREARALNRHFRRRDY